MRYNLPAGVTIALALALSPPAGSADVTARTSTIRSVKLYQNQASITRAVTVRLSEGTNTVIIGDLPSLLYDWSVRGSLPKEFPGTIISLEIEEKAHVQKRQKNILEIEKKLEDCRDRDRALIDDLGGIRSQEKFLDSINDFTNQNVSKELATRIPQIQVWNDTLAYTARKRKELLTMRRDCEKRREALGKEIQKWEFELSQIAGTDYYRTYQSLNKAILNNRSNMQIQQFTDISGEYAERNRLLRTPGTNVDIEKRIVLNVYAGRPGDAEFTFSYVIPSTSWQMKYDLRADSAASRIAMVVYGNVYQKTGEQWKDILLSLSTGLPVNAISPPALPPWYLDIARPEYDESAAEDRMSGTMEEKKAAPAPYKKKEKGGEGMDAVIREQGPYFEIALPIRQTIESSAKYQKKYITEHVLEGDRVRFFFEVTPERAKEAYMKAAVTNTTALPWLAGAAQIFMDGEFMGNVAMPYTPIGKKEEIALGVEPRISARKELVKKYEDTAGILGGRRRILYSYKVTVENQLPGDQEIIIADAIPVSRNKEIGVEIKNASHPFWEDKDILESTWYAQGIRKWKLAIGARKKVEITYDIIVTFDHKIGVDGLR